MHSVCLFEINKSQFFLRKKILGIQTSDHYYCLVCIRMQTLAGELCCVRELCQLYFFCFCILQEFEEGRIFFWFSVLLRPLLIAFSEQRTVFLEDAYTALWYIHSTYHRQKQLSYQIELSKSHF